MPNALECLSVNDVITEEANGNFLWTPGGAPSASNRVCTREDWEAIVLTNGGQSAVPAKRLMDWTEMQAYRRLNWSEYAALFVNARYSDTEAIIASGSAVFTLECWIKPNSAGTAAGVIFSCDGGSDLSVRFGSSSSPNNIRVGGRDTAGTLTSTIFTSANSIVTGQWHHLAVVSTGSVIRIYIDGALSASASFALRTTAASSYSIGSPSSTNFWMDDFRMWSTARSASNIANNKDEPIDPGSSGLVCNLRLENNATDAVGFATFTKNGVNDISFASPGAF